VSTNGRNTIASRDALAATVLEDRTNHMGVEREEIAQQSNESANL